METSINSRILELIEKTQLTPNAFASQLGIKTTIIYNIQKSRNKPSFDLLQNIHETFKVNADWLLSGRGDMFTNDVGKYNKSDTTNVNLNSDNDVNLNAEIDKKSSFASETEYMNKVHVYIKKINGLYQRLVDIRVLLFQELKYKGEFSTQTETDLLNSLSRPIMENTDEGVYLHYPYENLDLNGKKQYLRELENCIDLFTDTFFEAFKQLYNGIRIPADDESRKEFMKKREAITNKWNYTHYIKSYS